MAIYSKSLTLNFTKSIILVKFTNLTNIMNIYTLKLFNTGQITLPKSWRKRFKTKNFIAKETKDGLLIQPLRETKIVYFENKKDFGLYCENGLPVDEIINTIKKIHGSD